MKTSSKGIEMIKDFEGCELTVYKDMVGFNTVGYGHRTDKPVGDKISRGMAEQLLVEDLKRFETELGHLVNVPVNQNQFDALICFSYNLGTAALARSSLLKQLNMKHYKEAAEQFLLWCHAGGKEVAGLKRRREAERRLFLS